MQTYPKLLLIEDNRSIASALHEALKNEYEIETAFSGKTGIYLSDSKQFDAFLLDLHLPDIYGLEVCQLLRERGVTAPILIISAESKVLSKISLLDAGANDYLTKPFSLGELKARLRVLLRQKHTAYRHRLKSAITVGPLELNPLNHEVLRNGVEIHLRKKEFLLLECLMTNAGNVVTRQQLIDFAWMGCDKPWANTIDVHIKYLRDKLDTAGSPKLITTVHGVGYRLNASKALTGLKT